MTTGLTTLATTHRVVHRVHDDTAVVGTAAEPAAASSLAARFESMVELPTTPIVARQVRSTLRVSPEGNLIIA